MNGPSSCACLARLFLAASLVLGAGAAAARAQDEKASDEGAPPPAPPPEESDLGKRVEDLERENEELRRRLDAIERDRGAPAPAPPAEGVPSGEGAPAGEGPEVEVEAGRGSGFGIEVRYGDVTVSPKVFGDAAFFYREPPAENKNFGQTFFFLGELDFFITAAYGERFQALSETVIESRIDDDDDEDEDDGDDGDEEFEVEVERLWIQYAFAPWFKLKLGREHDALTYWNRRFHHGAWIQTTLSRPRLVQFEEDDGLLPIDVTGLEANGTVQTSAATLEYVLAVYNGRGRTPEEVQSVRDRNSAKAVSGHVRVSPAFHPSLWIGGSAYWDEIPEDERRDERDGSIREWIFGGFFVERIEPVEVIGEALWIQHADHASDRTFHSFGSYLQASVAVDDVTPYARFEFVDIDRRDPFYSDEAVQTVRGIVGARWDVHDSVAIKLEYGYAWEEIDEPRDRESVHRLGFQVAFVF